jgi:Domain of unknown function (DUF4278)
MLQVLNRHPLNGIRKVCPKKMITLRYRGVPYQRPNPLYLSSFLLPGFLEDDVPRNTNVMSYRGVPYPAATSTESIASQPRVGRVCQRLTYRGVAYEVCSEIIA